jgi:hypothetical protein
MDLADYEAVGTLQDALNIHAEEAYAALSERQQEIAEKLFKCLTEIDAGNRKIRRAATLGQICAVAAVSETSEHKVVEVIDRFRKDGHWFLIPQVEEKLTSNRLIDISHESLIRKWKRLGQWVEEEAVSRGRYLKIVEEATEYRKEEDVGRLWRDPKLKEALDWLSSRKPNQAWADLQWLTSRKSNLFLFGQHDPHFTLAIDFLGRSKNAQDRTKLLKFSGALAIGALILSILGIWAYFKTQQAKVAEEKAALTERLKQTAEENARIAKEKEEEALRQQTRAEEDLHIYRLVEALSPMYRRLEHIPGPDAERIRKELDSLAIKILPERYPYSLYEASSSGKPEQSSAIVTGAKVDRTSFASVIDFLERGLTTMSTLEKYIQRVPQDMEEGQRLTGELDQARNTLMQVSHQLSGRRPLFEEAIGFVSLKVTSRSRMVEKTLFVQDKKADMSDAEKNGALSIELMKSRNLGMEIVRIERIEIGSVKGWRFTYRE